MTALLRRGKLVFEVNTSRACLDHGFHQFERVQVPSEASLGIGDQGSKPVDSVLSLSMVNLVSAGQRLVDTPDNIRHAISWIQALVGIHLAGVISIGGHLPTAHIDTLPSSLDLLNGLVAGPGAQRRQVRLAGART